MKKAWCRWNLATCEVRLLQSMFPLQLIRLFANTRAKYNFHIRQPSPHHKYQGNDSALRLKDFLIFPENEFNIFHSEARNKKPLLVRPFHLSRDGRDSLDPCGQQGQHRIESKRGDCQSFRRRRRWTEVRIDLRCRQEYYEAPKHIPALGTREHGHARI